MLARESDIFYSICRTYDATKGIAVAVAHIHRATKS